ncbi:MAG: glycosyltransferase family 1 protein [Gemmatimonadota bacterium]
MRIGIDATCWANARGYGRFTRELLKHLVDLPSDHEFVFFLDAASDERFDLQGPRVRRKRVGLAEAPTQAASAEGYRSPLDLLRMTHAAATEPLDVFFFPSVYTYFPLPLDLPAVVTIHDAIAERFPDLTFATRRARLFWNAKVALAIRQSRRVLTVSDFSRRDLAQRLGLDPDRIDVTEEGAAEAYRPADPRDVADAAARLGLGPSDRWFTYVGGFNPHKNVDVLVRAHAGLCRREEHPPFLLLVGGEASDVFHGAGGLIRSTIEREGSAAWVRWTGFLPDEELALLHSGAVAVVLPSACEGFGLPAVEGAACGCPVIATTESPLPELLSGGGRFVHPGDERSLRLALQELFEDPGLRDELGRTALQRAQALSWREGAQRALASLEEAAA